MNLVSLLIAPAVILYSTGPGRRTPRCGSRIAVVAALIVAGAVFISKRRPIATAADLDDDGGTGRAGPRQGRRQAVGAPARRQKRSAVALR